MEGAVIDQVVVGSHLGEGADREGRRLGRSLDSLLGILVFGEGIVLPFGGDEILVGRNLDCEVTEVTGRDLVVRTDNRCLAMLCFVGRFPVLASNHSLF